MSIFVPAGIMPLIALIAVCLGGCGPQDTYGVGVINKTGEKVDGVTVSGAGGPIIMGFMPKDGCVTWSSFPGRAPDALIVSWIDTSNRKHSVEVSLKGVSPPHFRGTIYLKIRPKDQVQATAIADNDIDAVVKLRQSP